MKRPAQATIGDEVYVTLQRAAAMLHLNQRQVRRLLADQQLAFAEIRGALRVPLAEIERYSSAIKPVSG